MHYIRLFSWCTSLFGGVGGYDVTQGCSAIGLETKLAFFGDYTDALEFAQRKAHQLGVELRDDVKEAKNQGRKAK